MRGLIAQTWKHGRELYKQHMSSATQLCVGLSITRVDKAAINFLSRDLF